MGLQNLLKNARANSRFIFPSMFTNVIGAGAVLYLDSLFFFTRSFGCAKVRDYGHDG